MKEPGNVIPFPTPARKGLTEIEILQGTLTTLLGRVDELEELDEDSVHTLIISLNTVVAWLEERVED